MNKQNKTFVYAQNEILTKITSILMVRGKKERSEKILISAFSLLKKKGIINPWQTMFVALSKIKPLLEVKSVRVSGSTYQVPVPVDNNKQMAYALRWLLESARSRKEKTMEERIASEIWDILNEKGSSIEKRNSLHRMAEGNQAYIHFRW